MGMEHTLIPEKETPSIAVEVKKSCSGSTTDVCCEDSTESCSVPEARDE